jgi:hypothetical protein
MIVSYDLDIIEAILSIEEVEGFHMAINIPDPTYEFLRYKKYPYKTSYIKAGTEEEYEKCYRYRIAPYLMDAYDIRKGESVNGYL